LADIDLKSLVRLGAQTRLGELIAEVDAILAAFPDLGHTAVRRAGSAPQAKPVRKRKRSRMTPEQKKAVSARMKTYWAGRRKAKQG
jgi:hypothetical protein